MSTNNAAILNGALAGISGGGLERWITSPTTGAYASYSDKVAAIATAIDAAIPTDAGIGIAQGRLMQSICQGVYANRDPLGTGFSSIVAAIVAAYTTLSANLVAESGGGGGGGYQTIQVNGSDLPTETTLNFIGADVHGSDNPPVMDITFGSEGVSLSHSPSLVQCGASVINPSFTAAYTVPPTTVTLTDTEGNNDVIALPGTAFISPHTFTKTAYAANVTFTDTVTSPAGPASGNYVLTWTQPVKYGSQVDPGVYNSAFIAGLASTSLQLTGNGNFAYNTGVGESAFYASRTAFGLTSLDFTLNGLPFAVTKVASAVPFTNSDGVTENYDVWMSDNTGLGAFSILVA